MDLRDEINDTSGTAAYTLSKALVRAEEEDWRGVIVLGLAGDNGSRLLKSATLNAIEALGLLHWGVLFAGEQAMEGLTEPEESV